MSDKRPTYTAQRFLSVHVPKGSSQAQIADAVCKALVSREVPYFKDRIASSAAAHATIPSTQVELQGGAADDSPDPGGPAGGGPDLGGAAGGLNDSDALLILVQQEGQPGGDGG